MSDDEREDEDVLATTNKQYTIYVIDGSERMFEDGKNCAFRKALRVVFNNMIVNCAGGMMNHRMGLIITNTVDSVGEHGTDHFVEFVKLAGETGLGIGQDELLSVQELLDADDIHEAFEQKFGGHYGCDLSKVFYVAHQIIKTAGKTNRSQNLFYFTNEPFPCGEDYGYNPRNHTVTSLDVQRIMQNAMRFKGSTIRKVKGTFNVVLIRKVDKVGLLGDQVCDDDDEDDPEYTMNDFRFWKLIDDSVDRLGSLHARVYQKTFNSRAYSNILFELGPGVNISLSLYVLAAEKTLPKHVYVDRATEAMVPFRQDYFPASQKASASTSQEDESFGDLTIANSEPLNETKVREKFELKKMLKIGGEEIVSDIRAYDKLSHFDSKGLTLLGFRSLDKLDLESQHIAASRFIVPNDEQFLGSMELYTALWRKCVERQMGMICRFSGRSNEAVRFVALVPQKTDSSCEDDDVSSTYSRSGFHVVYLPYREDVRDLSEKLTTCSNPDSEWPQPSTKECAIAKDFLRRLQFNFSPDGFANPRNLSFNAMIAEQALGKQQVHIEDRIVPYYQTGRASDCGVTKALDALISHFGLTKSGEGDAVVKPSRARKAMGDDEPEAKRTRKEDLMTADVPQLAKEGMLNKLTMTQLRAAISEHVHCTIKAGVKKQELIDILLKFFNK